MGFIELLVIGISLSMDAFAVAVCKGLSMKKINYRHAVIIAVFFGGFQALMPFIGWLLGGAFKDFISPVDHWIAFVLLVIIGGKMILDSVKELRGNGEESSEGEKISTGLDYKELLGMAIATSIDALAMGITFAFLGVNIVLSVSVIGITTFILSFLGVLLGHVVGAKFQSAANIVGGCALILIGLKIVLEHLGILVL